MASSLLDAALVASGGVLGIFSYSFASAWLRRGAPFVFTASQKIDAIFHREDGLVAQHIPIEKRRHAIDLGSGAGALVRAAIKQGQFKSATGIEINPVLIALAQLRAGPGEEHRLDSLWSADLQNADLVLVYGVPSMLGQLSDKLRAEMKHGSHIISNQFPMAADNGLRKVEERWVNVPRDWLSSEIDDSGPLFLYCVHREEKRE